MFWLVNRHNANSYKHAFDKFNSQMAMGSFVSGTVVVKSLYTLSYLKQLRSKREFGDEKEKW